MNAVLEFRERDSRFDRLTLRTGLFIALAFLLIAAVIAGALVRQGVFTQTSSLYFFSDSALGISRGMSVQLSGFKIGTVEELALEPDARVKTRLVVKTEYMRHITQDAEARLAKEGLIGASFIEIVPGSAQARPMPNNGVVKFERADDFGQIASALADKLHPILDDVKKLTEAAADPGGDFRAILRNVREATAALGELQKDLGRLARTANERADSVSGQVGRVLERADVALEKTGGAIDKASSAIDKASGAIDTLHGTLGVVDKQLPEALERLERTLANVENVTSDALRISSGLATDLPPAVSDTRGVIEDAREIVDGAKRSWPIRGFLIEPLEHPLPLDSHDGAGRP